MNAQSSNDLFFVLKQKSSIFRDLDSYWAIIPAFESSNSWRIVYVIKYFTLKKVHEQSVSNRTPDIMAFLKLLMMELKDLKVKMGGMESSQKYEMFNKEMYLYVQACNDEFFKNRFNLDLIQR